MCCISGFISNQPLPSDFARNLVAALLYYGQERGSHSAGAFVLGSTPRIFKKAECGSDLFKEEEFKAMFDETVTMALCHNRLPTSGGRGDDSAQPFQREGIVTIHNGHYSNAEELKNKFTLKKHSGVDSELVADFLSEYGIDMLPKFLEETWGSSAIAAFYEGKLYVVRNTNPLWISHLNFGDDFKLTVFASTEEILDNAIRFVSLVTKTGSEKIKENMVFLVEPGEHKAFSDPIPERKYTHCAGYGYEGGWRRWDETHTPGVYAGKEEPKDDKKDDVCRFWSKGEGGRWVRKFYKDGQFHEEEEREEWSDPWKEESKISN